MAERTESSTQIAAPAEQVLEVIADFGSYPQWAKVKEATVLSRGSDGRPERVRFTLDAGVIKDTYVLDYDWQVAEDGTGSVSWSLVEASVLTAMDGSYELSQAQDTTTVRYRLAVDVTIPMLGLLKRKAEKAIVETALAGLNERVESR